MTSRVLKAAECCGDAILFLASLLAAGLVGCVSNPAVATSNPPNSPISNPPSSPANITGNWQFIANPGPAGGIPIATYLTSANGVVSGTAQVQMAFPLYCAPNGCCGGPFYVFNRSLTGTVDAKGNLMLGSNVPNGGPVFTMTGQVNGESLNNGNYTLTGSCSDQGAVAGTEYPALNGTYTGTLTSQITGQSFAISATFDQSTAVTLSGVFDVTGTANLTGYPCVTSASVTGGSFLGNNLEVAMNAVPGGLLDVSGVLSPDGKTLALSYVYVLMGSNCNNDGGTGTLTLQ